MSEDSKDSVKRAITEAAVNHYELLLESRESNKRIDAVSSEAILKSNLLRETLGKLQFHSHTMAGIGASWREEKQILTNAMSRYPQLLAVAEAPSLLRDCIYNGMYHQALLLMEHMSRISPRDSKPNNLFTRIQLELWKTLDACFEEVILPRLSESLTVDATFKLITFLRRLGIDKSCVRDLFLERRTIYLDKLMQEAESSPVPYTRAIKLIKLYKNQTSEVITQYGACFLSMGEDAAWGDGIQGWCYVQAERFLAAFERCVRELTNGAELGLVMEQCGDCAGRVGRVHMDLSAATHAVLLHRTKELFLEQMAHAERAYTSSMHGFSWRNAPTVRAATNTATGRGATGSLGASMMNIGSVGGSALPPAVLANCLPLACAVNGLLTAFNFCRKHVTPGLALHGAEHVVELLRRIAGDLVRDAVVVDTLTTLERSVYYDFVRIFVEVLYPYVLDCTSKLFGVGARQWVENSMESEVVSLSKRLPSDPPTTDLAKIPASSSQTPGQKKEKLAN